MFRAERLEVVCCPALLQQLVRSKGSKPARFRSDITARLAFETAEEVEQLDSGLLKQIKNCVNLSRENKAILLTIVAKV